MHYVHTSKAFPDEHNEGPILSCDFIMSEIQLITIIYMYSLPDKLLVATIQIV